MSDAGGTWPEQDAVVAWLDERGLPRNVFYELASAVTEYRLDVQRRLTDTERQLREAQERCEQLAATLHAIRDGVAGALHESATAGGRGSSLYINEAAACAFGDVAVAWIEEQIAALSEPDEQAKEW